MIFQTEIAESSLSGTQQSPGNKPQGKLTIAEDEKIEDDILDTLRPEEIWIESSGESNESVEDTEGNNGECA